MFSCDCPAVCRNILEIEITMKGGRKAFVSRF